MRKRAQEIVPGARKERLIVQELPDETLVYDLDRHKAHCLNKTSAFVWKHCDGKVSVGQLTTMLEKTLGTMVDDDVVWLAIRQLQRFHLLEVENKEFGTIKVTRRDLVSKYLPAALVLPVILSIPSPAAAQGGSSPCTPPAGRPNGCPCTIFTQCATNCCTGGTCQPAFAC